MNGSGSYYDADETYYNSNMEFWSDCKKTIIEFVDKFDIK